MPVKYSKMKSFNSIKHLLVIILPVALILTSCGDKEKPAPVAGGLQISFEHVVDNQPLEVNEMKYTNAAGNPYEVAEVMYFISELKLYKQDGTVVIPNQWNNIHYADSRYAETLLWNAGNNIPPGTYDSLTFTFGLSEEINKSFMFVNPPEVNMAWPEVLGGGYHYMMLNGFWLDTLDQRRSYNFHLGIGQIYANNSGQVGDITGFVHNNFTVKPAGQAFTVAEGTTLKLTLTMHIDSWFNTPFVYDHNQWGGAIMQNQDAMHIGCLNGRDVFTIGIVANR
jgi:hypothetical protein